MFQQQQQQQEMFSKLLASSQQQQSQPTRLSHVPVAVPVPTQFHVPPPPSLSPLPPDLQMMVTNAQPSRELLQRPEAQAIIQGKNTSVSLLIIKKKLNLWLTAPKGATPVN